MTTRQESRIGGEGKREGLSNKFLHFSFLSLLKISTCVLKITENKRKKKS